jgi:FAD/FMN-containing dehydrogenase
VLRLHPRPRSRCAAFCAVPDYDRALELLSDARGASAGALSAFEVMWPDYYTMVTTRVAGLPRPLPPGAPLYVLLEVLGGDQASDLARLEQLLASAADAGLVGDAAIAQSESDAADFWKVRDATGEFPRIFWPHVAFDVGIPTRHIGAFVDRCRPALHARWPEVEVVFYGHIGDANLHLCARVCDGAQPEDEVEALVYGLVREFQGTISAEHGIGLHKRAYLEYCRTPAEIALMRTLKQAIDPKGILNPEKILGRHDR